MRAYCHALGAATYVGFLVHWLGSWGFFGLCIPFLIELFQWITKSKTSKDWEDTLWDLGEHLTGGTISGCLFYAV